MRARESHQLPKVNARETVVIGTNDIAARIDPVVLGSAFDLELLTGGRIDNDLQAKDCVGAAARSLVHGGLPPGLGYRYQL